MVAFDLQVVRYSLFVKIKLALSTWCCASSIGLWRDIPGMSVCRPVLNKPKLLDHCLSLAKILGKVWLGFGDLHYAS